MRSSSAISRGDDESSALDTYHPRMLTRQNRIDSDQEQPMAQRQSNNEQNESRSKTQNKWLSRLTSSKTQLDLRQRLSRQIGRLSSLDSTRTSSSMETDLVDQQQQQNRQTMPVISITSNEPIAGTSETNEQNQLTNAREGYNDYYGRPRRGMGYNQGDEEEDDDEDSFEDSPLPMPYSSSSMARSAVVRQQTESGISYPSTVTQYEELLDDRQGMNNSEQQFTKGERVANRHSIDGSIISELRLDCKKSFKDGKPRKDAQKRSKSPSSSMVKRNRHSRRGFLGLASRLKLTKKHESIAKLQLSILNSRFVSLKTLDRDLQSFLPSDRMYMKEFEERVQLMRRYEVLSTIEYRFASRYETYVCKHATRESNQPKNNYKKCIPYDYNRVVLKTLPNVPNSDYINASHVDSCLKPNAYIAAQGPNENTIEDFWRMVWEQKTFVIVMLTKVFDFIRVMCNQYWPVELNKPERYGSLEVTLLYEEPLADFVIRTIKLTKLKRNGDDDVVDNKSAINPETLVDLKLNDISQKKGEFFGDGSEDDDEDDYDSDDTSCSEDLILDEPQPRVSDTQTGLLGQNNNLTVRAPKFVGRARRARSRSPSKSGKRESIGAIVDSITVGDGDQDRRHLRAASQPPESLSTSKTPRPNEFLHPLFNAAATHHDESGTSLSSLVGSEPNTPLTPRTPSSAGLDRSSATRKAVKKKRRVRVKNQRPKRTQFMVPSESQLIDDEDDEDMNKSTAKHNERIIYQFHYNSWASHTCPFISSLLHFRRRVRICMDEMSKSGKTGPTVVHCNDGCGRTGTYLCIDANLELAEEDNVLDVFNYTKKMRQSRKFLIENLEQYKFVYDTIEEAMFCGKTWFPVSELHKRLKHKSQRNPLTKKNEYTREYEKITRMATKFSIGDCAGGHRVENREKNRDVSTVPPDNFRPYLTSFQTNDSTDYINAVFVDGYTRSKEYIVTEWPLHRTISDFWSLIYDHDCNSVILLANPGESSAHPSFLPSEKELRRKFGPVFSAEMVSYTHYQHVKSWIYSINKKIVSLTEVIAGVKSEAKTTQVFQITCWPQGHRVPTSTNALVELMNMVERWRQRTTYGPVCVVSLNGKSRAGVYCAANVAIEQVVQHSEVDVFQAVKTVRRHRPQLIENMTEYKYCYDLILHYVLNYVNQPAAST